MNAVHQVEKDEEYIKAVAALGTSMEELVKANNAIDIYEEYFTGRNLDYSTEKPEAKTIAGLIDPSGSKRGAQYVCWHPDGSSRLAVAHSILEFQKLQVSSGGGNSPSPYSQHMPMRMNPS